MDLSEAIAKKFVEASDPDNNGKTSRQCSLHWYSQYFRKNPYKLP